MLIAFHSAHQTLKEWDKGAVTPAKEEPQDKRFQRHMYQVTADNGVLE